MGSRNKLTMCRLCLCENECFVNIFELDDWQGYVAAEIITDLLQFKVSETDGYPQVVCSTCLVKLREFKLFKECCQKSKATYDDMFVSCESQEDHKTELVEFVTVKAEPIHYADNEDHYSKDAGDGGSDSELCEQDPLAETSPHVEHSIVDTVAYPQYLQRMEYKNSHCASQGAVEAVSCTRNVSSNGESVFPKSEDISLGEEVEASASGAVERSEGQCVPTGERIYVVPLFQQDAGIGRAEEKERGRVEGNTGKEEVGGTGTGPEKVMIEGSEIFKCKHCEKVFMTKGGLMRHLKVHGVGNSYECDVCGKLFPGEYELMRHALTHTGSKLYKCGECSKSFSQNGHLIIHMRSHTGSKPYKCAECSKSFSRGDILNKHMRSHTGFKPFVCGTCSRGFTNSSDLSRHLLVHTNEKPFECHNCRIRFSRREHLKTHLERHCKGK